MTSIDKLTIRRNFLRGGSSPPSALASCRRASHGLEISSIPQALEESLRRSSGVKFMLRQSKTVATALTINSKSSSQRRALSGSALPQAYTATTTTPYSRVSSPDRYVSTARMSRTSVVTVFTSLMVPLSQLKHWLLRPGFRPSPPSRLHQARCTRASACPAPLSLPNRNRSGLAWNVKLTSGSDLNTQDFSRARTYHLARPSSDPSTTQPMRN